MNNTTSCDYLSKYHDVTNHNTIPPSILKQREIVYNVVGCP